MKTLEKLYGLVWAYDDGSDSVIEGPGYITVAAALIDAEHILTNTAAEEQRSDYIDVLDDDGRTVERVYHGKNGGIQLEPNVLDLPPRTARHLIERLQALKDEDTHSFSTNSGIGMDLKVDGKILVWIAPPESPFGDVQLSLYYPLEHGYQINCGAQEMLAIISFFIN